VFSWIVIGLLRDKMSGYEILSFSDKTDSTAANGTSQPDRNARTNSSAILYNVITIPTLLNRTEIIKVWQYDLKFAVCYGTIQNAKNIAKGDPAYDKDLLNSIRQEMKKELNSEDGLPSLNTQAFLTSTNYTLKLSFTDNIIDESAPYSNYDIDTRNASLIVESKRLREENKWVS
jgi:hypothetical protein